MYSMYASPDSIRDIDPQSGKAITAFGAEVAIRKVLAHDEPKFPHPVEFDGYERPESAQLAARLLVAAEADQARKQ